jgi:hypothetical protein
LKLERINNVLFLSIAPECTISFKKEWVEHLRTLPYTKFGEYIRTIIYPALSSDERKLWNKSTINNRELHEAVQVEV